MHVGIQEQEDDKNSNDSLATMPKLLGMFAEVLGMIAKSLSMVAGVSTWLAWFARFLVDV